MAFARGENGTVPSYVRCRVLLRMASAMPLRFPLVARLKAVREGVFLGRIRIRQRLAPPAHDISAVYVRAGEQLPQG